MPGAAPKPNRNVALAWTVGKFAAAWGLARVVVIADSNLYNRAWFRWVVDAIYRVLAGFPAAAYQAEQIFLCGGCVHQARCAGHSCCCDCTHGGYSLQHASPRPMFL